jgi:hypothetical protein
VSSDCICPDVAQVYLPNCPVHGHISERGDVHTVPGDSKHESSSECWCMPSVVYIAPNGSQQWLHRGLS